ncbi:hypothetical protein SAMD00079811_45230 [Scytonema sp. HK-05]|uniref:hypothetical protein n=1 Tax=Scytonema sp. HK-05 TaxID=1137095 RepID=UPI000935C7FE|nr:hypothetical protein [Scytonema sp. HK-05]OKH46992.1 hypothetical protein NIES2130_36345 [Scytonema sp. HK-05]BAY46907.1 hypothetical protein SAMD00079811_45230 [Scytonema sp. HK-05]
MSIGRVILFIALVIPGLLVAGSSLYSFNTDYEALGRTERYVDKLVRDGRVNNRQLDLAYHRSLSHRMNAFANGTWGFIGATIAAIGVHGIATTKDETIEDQRKASK